MSILKNYVNNLKDQIDLLPLDEIESWGMNLFNYGKIINNYLSAEMVPRLEMPSLDSL